MFASDKKSTGQQPAPAEGEKSAQREAALNPIWQSLAFNSCPVQAKLAVSQPDDPHEREADLVADHIMREADASATHVSPPVNTSHAVQRMCAGCEEGETGTVQRKDDAVGSPPLQRKLDPLEGVQTVLRKSERPPHDRALAAPSTVLETLKSPGRELDRGLRSFFEPRLGYDLSSVRIHTDPLADASARAIQAKAFTISDHIAFRAGQYSPESQAGRTLIAHELTHVVQQGAAGRSTKSERAPESQPHAPETSGTPPAPANNGNGHGSPSPLNGGARVSGHGGGIARQINSPEHRDMVREPERVASRLPAIHPTWALPLSGSAPIVQRANGGPDKPKKAGVVVDKTLGDMTIKAWEDQGLMVFSLMGEPWVTVRWTPNGAAPLKLNVAQQDFPAVYLIEVKASHDIRVTLNGSVEEAYAKRFLGGAKFAHKYLALGHQVTINEHLPDAKTVAAYTEINEYEGHDLKINRDPELIQAEPAPPVTEPPPFWWEFDRVEQLDLMAAAHPQYYWVGLYPQSGRMRALNYTEEALQKTLVRFREDPEIAASVFKFYEDGKAWTSIDLLYDMFYAYPVAAKIGSPGDAPECVIFTHGKSSFGRKPLTHDEAMDTWSVLELFHTDNGTDAVANLSIDGRGQFFELVAAGKTAVWEIDIDYFDMRDVFLLNVDELKRDEGQDWSDLFHDNLAVWEHYLRYALDRDESQIDPVLAVVIDTDSDFVSAAGERIYERVQQFALLTAQGAIETSRYGIGVYLDDEKLRGLVLQFPFMADDEREKALTFLGFEGIFRSLYAWVLTDPEMAQLVAMGETINLVSLETLKYPLQKRYDELTKALESFGPDANPLVMEGEFGDEVRRITYQEFGFKLNYVSYPHEDEADYRSETLGGVRPGPLSSIYGTEAGYLFAQEAAGRARAERNERWLKIGLVVAASVALMIVSAGAGAALAGLLFSVETTAGFIAFTVTEVVISAALVTAAGPALNTFIMSGGDLDPELYKKAYAGIGWQFLMNVATFGFFKGLSLGIEAAAIAGAGGREAYMASGAWQAANTAARISISGGAMFGIALVSKRLETGKWPEGESLAEVLFETGLSIVLLEMGSFMARGSMKRIQDWSRTQRIGADTVAEMNKIRAEVTELNAAAAKFNADPLGKKQTGMELLAKQEALLKRQADVIERLNKSFRTSPDAEAFNKLIVAELAEIHARLAEIRGVRAFGKAEVRPIAAGGTGDVAEFTYKRGQEQVLKEYFGEKNVKDVGGVLEVMVEGPTGKKLIFRPATDTAAGIMPTGARMPDALVAWRSAATSRMREILRRSANLAADDKVLREISKADPSTMDTTKMRAFEKQLESAEKLLDKLEKKSGPAKPIAIDRLGDATETWRLRLVAERERLTNRARLLGLEGDPLVEEMNSYPMKRAGLKENTLENYRKAIEKVQKLLDKAQNDKLTALDQATGGPAKPVADLQTTLSGRRADVLRRAKLFGATGSQYILDVKSLAIGGAKKYSTLSGSEEIIARAEAKLDALAQKALANAVTVYGPDVIPEVRAGPGLEKLTDAQVGDVMRQLGLTTKLSPEALRGALLASYAGEALTPISIKRMVALSRSPAELEFVLKTFGELRDAQVGGSLRLLRDGVAGSGKWVGAVWEMKLAKMLIGIDKIRSFEVPKTTGTGNRVIDILLLDGRSVEAKDWATWLPEKVQEQFFRDLEINTVDGAVPSGMEKIRWIFNEPPPVSIADIRATMKTALEDFIVKKGLTKDKADALRDAFDAHTSLVEAPKLGLPTAKPGTPKPSKPIYTPPPPTRRDDE